jgi:hypothetical protein
LQQRATLIDPYFVAKLGPEFEDFLGFMDLLGFLILMGILEFMVFPPIFALKKLCGFISHCFLFLKLKVAFLGFGAQGV